MPLVSSHLGSPNGLLKILHLIFGGASLILVATAYIPYWTLDIFIGTVALCFALSLIYLILHMVVFDESFSNSRANRIISCVYHVAAGTFLIAAGIDLIGWYNYDLNCGFKCPHIYNIGVAKILTFINGTLYGIHGFMEIKDEDEDFHGESIPLITASRTPKAHCSKSIYKIHNSINA